MRGKALAALGFSGPVPLQSPPFSASLREEVELRLLRLLPCGLVGTLLVFFFNIFFKVLFSSELMTTKLSCRSREVQISSCKNVNLKIISVKKIKEVIL